MNSEDELEVCHMNKPAGRKALVLGATGVIGRAIAERAAATNGWRAVGVARRPPPAAADVEFLAADLLDAAQLSRHAAALADVTDMFVALRIPAPDAATEEGLNEAALTNIVEAVESSGAKLRHICLIHGTKWYGCHLGPYHVPARETDPRHAGANVYFAQHDVIRALNKDRDWTWSTLRPHTVWGTSVETGNSLISSIGAFAVISRELGLPLRFPGPVATYEKVSQGTTTGMLAEAAMWAATEPACAGEDFNLTNGDTFRWAELWPKVARAFGLEAAGPDDAGLGPVASNASKVWRKLAARHGLVEPNLSKVANWNYLDAIMQMTWDDVSSLSKIRRFGFDRQMDSKAEFVSSLKNLQRMHFLPD